jgi:hypothetical protein
MKKRIFADTNVIIEAFRTGCWTAICTTHAIETVEKCIEESLTGDSSDPSYVAIASADLCSGLTQRHGVTKKEIAYLVATHPSCNTLDDGELHLLARLFADNIPSPIILVSTADKAALIASHRLGWLDYAVSLEDIARQSGVNSKNLESLRQQHRNGWLSDIKTKILLGIMP